MRSLATTVLFVLFALGAPSARAVLTVDAASMAGTLPTGRTAPTYTIRWTLTKSALTGAVFSPTGTFVGQPGQVLLGSQPAALFDPNPSTSNSVLTERVRLPASVVDAAQRRGLTVTYSRTFQDSTLPIPQSGTSLVAIAPTGSLGGPFQVLRVQLEVDSGDGSSSLAIVEPGDALRAHAILSYSGSGILEAVWEVADAASTGGTPLFRPLRRIRRYLGSAGRIRLESPELPADLSGLQLARLRIVQPASAFPPEPIRFAVAANRVRPPPAEPLPVQAPVPRARLDATTRFRWSPVPNASAYQLELFERRADAGPSLPDEAVGSPRSEILTAGLLLPGRRVAATLLRPNDTETGLPALSLARLAPATAVLWRVRALDAQGRTLAESTPRELRVERTKAGNGP